MAGATDEAAPSAMTTADWAFVVSLCSFKVSLAGFSWAIRSEWIYPKAKVRASIRVMDLISDRSRDFFIGIYAPVADVGLSPKSGRRHLTHAT